MVATLSYGQIGGRYNYEFLGLPTSARLTALGGSLIAVEDGDVSLASGNPALLNSKMHNHATFSYDFHFDDINNGYVGYGRSFDSLGINTHIGVAFANYGDFVMSDAFGNTEGTFTGGETAVMIGASKNFSDRISIGANIKAIMGNLESYSSFGLAADLGLLYHPTDENTKIAFVVKNVGTELSAYGVEKGSTPLDVQIGVSRRLKYIPFRFSVTAHQLQKWGIKYDDPDAVDTGNIFGEEESEPTKISQGVDNLFRHLIFSGEFLLGKGESFKLRIAYNHLRRKELTVGEFRSLAGFSGGFGISIKGFQLDYGVGYHHLAGGTNHLTIATNFDRFTK